MSGSRNGSGDSTVDEPQPSRSPKRRTDGGRDPKRRTDGGRDPKRRTDGGRDPGRQTDGGRGPRRGGQGGGQYNAGARGQQPAGAPQAANSRGSYVTGPVTTAYVKFCAAIYAAIGVGIGLLVFILDAFGMSPVTVTWNEYSSLQGRTVERSEAIPLFSGEFLYPLLIILAIGVSVMVAVYVGRNWDLTDTEATYATGFGTGVGSLIMLVTGGFLGFQKLRYVELFESLSQGTTTQQASDFYTIEPLNLVVNALVVAVFAALISVAVVYSLRNLSPDQ